MALGARATTRDFATNATAVARRRRRRATTTTTTRDLATRARGDDGDARRVALLAVGDDAAPMADEDGATATGSARRALGRALSVDDDDAPGRPSALMKTPRPTVAPTKVPRWLAPLVDQYFVDHKAQARALREGRRWDGEAEDREYAAAFKLFKMDESERPVEMTYLLEDYPKLLKQMGKMRKARRASRAQREDTYPDPDTKTVKFGYQRIAEKMGVYPRIDGEATYAQFLEYLERREVTRVLLYEEGNMAIAEMGGPATHLDPNVDVIRWKVQIPGDAHDEVTRACLKAFYTKPHNPEDLFTPAQTPCHLFMNIKPWNVGVHGARNWLMASTFFYLAGTVCKGVIQADKDPEVKKRRALRQKMKNERAALAGQMGKSKAKLVKKNQSKVRFKDVAGQDMVVNEFQTIIDVMKGNPKYKGRYVEPPKGILLEGPPGTGKTLLAKAVAGEAGLPFFYANGSEFVEMFVGVAASRMRNLFKRARENAPSIIFIDELDTIGRARNAGEQRDSSTSEREQGLMQMLVEMDGFDNKESGCEILVIGATNLATQLDPALLRSGRFDRTYHIGVPPTSEARMPILQVHARNLNIDRGGDDKYESDAFLHRVADLTTGFSGAELANVLNEAAILSVREGKDSIDINDIEAVLEKQAVGLISAPLDDGWGKEHLAIIEAAKAVIYSARPELGPELLQVSIRPRGTQMSGLILTERSSEAEAEIRTRIGPDTLGLYIDALAVTLTGRCAELHFFGPDGVSIRTNEEVSAAAEMAFDIVTTSGLYPDSKFAPHFDMAMVHQLRIPRENMEKGTLDVILRAHTKGMELIKEYAPLIERVANELMENERLYGSTVRAMVKKYQQEELGGNFTRTPSFYERAAMNSASSN